MAQPPKTRRPQSVSPRRLARKEPSHTLHAGEVPPDVAAIRNEIRSFFRSKDKYGKTIGSSKFGVYVFYDYDGEPIYVGQTYEGLGARISRHLTNQRTDAVAMNVLDPFEVAEIRVWPLEIGHLNEQERGRYLNMVEYTVFQRVIEESTLHAILNEKPPGNTELIDLPADYRRRIIPEEIYPLRKHADIRIARRANTIASLARVISERKVSRGLRNTLLTQARRLEYLAAQRLKDFKKD